MASHEHQFSLEELKQIQRKRERMNVLSEFFQKTQIARNTVS